MRSERTCGRRGRGGRSIAVALGGSVLVVAAAALPAQDPPVPHGERPPQSGSQQGPKPNRLAASASPYLKQHQHNPVDWYLWGEEALARAKRED
jgi:hypothetical protein